MGIMEDIAASLQALHDKVDAMGGIAAPSPAETKAAEKKATAAEKKAAEKPAFSAEELRDRFIAVKEKFGDVAAKQLIADCGYERLAVLVGDQKNWHKSWELATAKLEEEPVESEDNGGL